MIDATMAQASGGGHWSNLDELDWDFRHAHTTTLTHGLHPYPAKFIPQIPRALIQQCSVPGQVIADVFCGSGTTLVEGLALGRNVIGIDANPLACLISEAKTRRLSPVEIDQLRTLAERGEQLADEIAAQRQRSAPGTATFRSAGERPRDDSLIFWFAPFVIEELAEALSWCKNLGTPDSQSVALMAFSAIVVAVSRQDSDTRYVRREKFVQPGETLRRFARSVNQSADLADQFAAAVSPSVIADIHCANVLDAPSIPMFDMLVCSPPYPNAYSYHLYHMTRMLWLGMDQVAFKRVEIGSHRKYSSRSPMRATKETFKEEMTSVMRWIYKHLQPNGISCFVIGNSTIGGHAVDNAAILIDAARENGFIEQRRYSRRIQSSKKSFNPAIGKIKTEHILVLQRTGG